MFSGGRRALNAGLGDRMKWLTIAGATLILLATCIGDALAVGCGDITPGARMGPDVPAGEYNNAFTLPYDDVCYVQWLGGTRGAAGRDIDERKCRNLKGAELVEFVPDRGQNYNMCIFRILASAESGEQNGTHDSGDNVAPSSQGYGSGGSEFGGSQSPPPGQLPQDATASKTQQDYGTYYLEICNQSSSEVSVAVALYENPSDTTWTVKGWWNILPDKCRFWTKSLGPYPSHAVAYHAENAKGTWGSGFNLCVRDSAFSHLHRGGEECLVSERVAEFTKFNVTAGVQRRNLTDD
jgi:uncharacterized membrane protein